MRVLGIDVGLRVCGFCICEVEGLSVKLIRDDEIRPSPHLSLPQRLNYIFEELKEEIKRYDPKAIAVEKLYSHYRHPTTLGILAQVRGVIALLAYQLKLSFHEYSATRIRKSFLGKGDANSAQIRKMAEDSTGKRFKSVHTADAFSVVVAFSHDQKIKRLYAQIARSRRPRSLKVL